MPFSKLIHRNSPSTDSRSQTQSDMRPPKSTPPSSTTTTLAATPHPSLCAFCAAIDFEPLRLPTVRDLEALNSGSPRPECYPFSPEPEFPYYFLGSQLRIQQSSQKCPLCKAICEVLDTAGLRGEIASLQGSASICEAQATRAGTINPPKGTKWKIDSRPVAFRRIQLRWRETHELDPQRGPGPVVPSVDKNKTVKAFGAFQVFGGEDDVFSGRRRSGKVDVAMMRRWVKDCDEKHGGECRVLSKRVHDESTRVPLIRLIDVKTRTLVELPNVALSAIHYVALSYVWGPISAQRILMNSETRPGLLTSNWISGRIAQTIQDSIEVADALGLPYIWVDALCIQQDSNEDLKVQIAQMGKIYRNASLTLIAASGADASKGLSGLRKPRPDQMLVPVTQSSKDTKGLTLMTTLNPGRAHYTNYSDKTVWAGRAWTLQEKLLSARCLTFTDNQVYFSCPSSHRLEETELETPLARLNLMDLHETDLTMSATGDLSTSVHAPTNEDERLWWSICKLIRKYSARQMTGQGDARDAFGAVVQEFEEKVGEFVWGIPASRLEAGLFWDPHRLALKRRTATTKLEQWKFPSWSWLGWQGQSLVYLQDKFVEEGLTPTISCFILRQNPTRLVPLSSLARDDSKRATPLSATKPSRDPISMVDLEVHLPKTLIKSLPTLQPNSILFFWGEIAYFSTRLRRKPFEVTQADGSVIATHKVDILNPSDHEGVVGTTCVVQNGQPGHDATDEDMKKWDAIRVFVKLGTNGYPGFGSIVVALMVVCDGGIWYREAIADVNEDAWEKAEPTKTLIALG